MLSGSKSGFYILNTVIFTVLVTSISSRVYISTLPASVNFQREYGKSILNRQTCESALVQSTWQNFKILDSSYPITHDTNKNEDWIFSGEFNPGTCQFKKFT